MNHAALPVAVECPPVQRESLDHDAGFTLLELLIGLALLAMIAVLLASAMSSAGRGLAGLERRAGNATVEVVQTHLRAVIETARPIRLPELATDAPLIEARDTSLRLISGFSPAGQYGGLTEIDLQLTPGSREGLWDLSEIRTLYRPAPQPGQPPPLRPRNVSRLFADVAGFRLLYFGAPSDTSGALLPRQWRDTWTDPTRLPDLVAIDVLYPPGDPRAWPTLIVPMPSGH